MKHDRVCANGPAMSRRNLLAALPATPLAFAPQTAEASEDTPIRRMFFEWCRLCQLGQQMDDEELEKITDRMIDIEEKMMSLPSQTIADLAMKLCIHDDFGEGDRTMDSAFWTEVRGMVPIWRPFEMV